jgi:hypothetical protein
MRKAVVANAPVHLLVAAEFLPPAERRAAVGFLAGVLSGSHEDLRPAALGALSLVREASVGDPLTPLAQPLLDEMRVHPDQAAAIGEGLTALTGAAVAPDARLWEDWGRRQAAAKARVTPEAAGVEVDRKGGR